MTATGVKGSSGKMTYIRCLLDKALCAGLTESESVFLRGELERLSSLTAKINAAVGSEYVSLSPHATLLRERGAVVVI